MNPHNFGIVLVFFFHSLKITQTSEAEDFNPLDHITAGNGVHFNQDEVSVDEGEPSVHLDERCRCTCPPFDVPEVARMGGKIYTGQVDNARDCSCQNIVLPSIPDLKPDNYQLVEQQVCPACRCVYQRRNLTVIYAVVVFLIILISSFAIYLLITQIIYPRFLFSVSYKEQRDDEGIIMEEVAADSTSASGGQDEQQNKNDLVQTGNGSDGGGQETEMLGMNRRSRFPCLNMFWHHQSQWQEDLNRQQRNIYTDHAMLN